MPKHSPPSVPSELIEQKIYLIRGHKVMLDADVAELYGVTTGNLRPAHPPYAFTEQGVAMLSSVLNSERAIEVNIAIMRPLVRLRAMLATHADLARRLNELEEKYDEQFRVVFEAIRELMAPEPVPPARQIGFATNTRTVKTTIRIVQNSSHFDISWYDNQREWPDAKPREALRDLIAAGAVS